MKNLKINFREPNVDRFVELMYTAIYLKMPFRYCIVGMPRGYTLGRAIYNSFPELNAPASYYYDHRVLEIEEAQFTISFPDVGFDRCFTTLEPVEDIVKRIKSAIPIESPSLDETCLELLKTATERLGFSRDQLQDVINLSYVIACHDGDGRIEAYHVSEAINYSPATLIPD